ncbi:alpha/beta fold hydrolase [Dickeya lacustris]|uniref:alpha/beta fold hydrolase n=1 Tax=Dickeya lacustris TaxID=2259638 RepID=UPI003A4C5FE7
MTPLRRLFTPLALAAGLLGAQGQVEAEVVKNIVLVHGAFADGSSFAAVTRRLQAKGYHVTAVQNPLTSLDDDVAATERVLARQHGRVLLVGHSWGGAVVTQAANHPNVAAMVYLSALVPDSGESVSTLLKRLGAPMHGLTPDSHGFVWLDDVQQYRTMMAADVAPQTVRALVAAQQPIALDAFNGTLRHAAWRDKPSWYLMTKKDSALAFSVQEKIAHFTGSRVAQLDSSHMSMVSHPAEVAAFIDNAAKQAH